jgi:hypothetical protein
MKKKIALVTMAKDEDLYIQEWIDYHLKLGFDSIFIYQNNWRFNSEDLDERVHLLEWDIDSPGDMDNTPWLSNRIAMAYTHFGKTYHDQFEWAAFIDVDGFLVLKQTNDVKEFIAKFDNVPQRQVVINLAQFGDNGHTEFDPNNASVLERFTKRWGKPYTHTYYHVGPICKLHENFDKHGVHMVHDEEWIDVDGVVGIGTSTILNCSRKVSYDTAQLNHYYTKTLPEWLNKCNRTRPEGDQYRSTIEGFFEHNHNDVEDFHALNFFRNQQTL